MSKTEPPTSDSNADKASTSAEKSSDTSSTTAAKSSASSKSTNTSTKKAQPAKNALKNKLLSIVGIVLVFCLLGVGFLTWSGQNKQAALVSDLQETQEKLAEQLQLSEQNAQVQAALRAEVTSLLSENEKLNGQQAQINLINTKLERKLEEQLNTQQKSLENMEKRLHAQQQRILSLSTTSTEDWLLAEAEYLLKLANQRVLLERNPSNAIALLTEADSIIHRVSASIGDQDIFTIREAIAVELSQLKAIPAVDIEGVYLQLTALIKRVEQTPIEIQKPSAEFAKNSTEEKNTDGNSFWQKIKQEFASIRTALANSFNHYKIDELQQPIVSTRSQQLIQLNLRTHIEQAQLALLKQDKELFSHALEQAYSLLSEARFAPKAATSLKHELTEIKDVDVAPNLPDISKSLKLLQNYNEYLHIKSKSKEQVRSDNNSQ